MIILTAGVIAVFNDYEWYDTTIVKIEKVNNALSKETKGNSIGKKHYKQTKIQKVFG